MVGNFISDFALAIATFFRLPSFMSRHKLWKGFSQHKLVLLAILLLGLASGLTFLQAILDWWQGVKIDDVADIGIQTASLFSTVFNSEFNLFNSGAYKYLVLIVMELLIFHAVIKTRSVLTGEVEQLTAKVFISAQIRMIKVSLFIWIAEVVVKILISVALSIIGLTFLKEGLSFLMECFFLGFALVDNYNELNGMGIKPSFQHTLRFSGAAAAIGLVLYVLIFIPVIGPLVGTLFGAVAATIVMHELAKRDPLRADIDYSIE
ncbi:MAG: hypothetical protein HKN87_01685 [Saprospiraceae bacterium]|nr:hypothetical protein [Saprospiraceae bacterium]